MLTSTFCQVLLMERNTYHQKVQSYHPENALKKTSKVSSIFTKTIVTKMHLFALITSQVSKWSTISTDKETISKS